MAIKSIVLCKVKNFGLKIFSWKFLLQSLQWKARKSLTNSLVFNKPQNLKLHNEPERELYHSFIRHYRIFIYLNKRLYYNPNWIELLSNWITPFTIQIEIMRKEKIFERNKKISSDQKTLAKQKFWTKSYSNNN